MFNVDQGIATIIAAIITAIAAVLAVVLSLSSSCEYMPRPKSTFVQYTLDAKTRDDDDHHDDREGGAVNVELFHGSKTLLSRKLWEGTEWERGQGEQITESDLKIPLSDKPIRAVVALEELPGQVNITWDADISVTTVNSSHQQLRFEAQPYFNTDGDRDRHEIQLGEKSFP